MSLSRMTESSPLIPKEGEPLKYFEIKKDILVMQKKEKKRGFGIYVRHILETAVMVYGWLVWEEA